MRKVNAVLEQIEQLDREENEIHERIRQIGRIKDRLTHELRQLRSPFMVVWDHGKGDHETKYVIDREAAELRLRDALAFIREHASVTPYQLTEITPDVYEFTYQPTFTSDPRSGRVFIANNPLFESVEVQAS